MRMTDILWGVSKMTDLEFAMNRLAELCVEGVRRYGDNPQEIAKFFEREFSVLDIEEKQLMRQHLLFMTEGCFTNKERS